MLNQHICHVYGDSIAWELLWLYSSSKQNILETVNNEAEFTIGVFIYAF